MNTYIVYDTVGRKVKSVGNYVAQATPPDDWVWREVSGVFGWRLSATNDTLVSHGANNDQNIISANTYNKAGIVVMTIDVQGKRNFMVYDALNRLVKTVQNAKPDATIEFGVGHPNYDATNDPRSDDYQPLSDPDKDIISQTEYNKAGQVMNTTDPHGTVTEFGYDVAGRRVSITQAEGTALETISYTCFNKAGWVLRMISNYIATSTSPDAKTGTAWDFNPSTHGTYNDENLITEYEFDALGRQTKIINPLGEFTSTTYAKDGSVMTVTDQEGTVTAYRYDTLRRRRMVVQGYVANGEDPSLWVCDTSGQNPVWKQSGGTLINHGTDNDQNIIIQLTHDIAGRVMAMRNPRGFVTEYEYDHLNRRVSLTNPLAHTWATSYAELGDGGRRTTQSFPNGYDVVRDFDRMGRLMRVDYGQPSATPNVQFEYDVLGNRTAMNELGVADDLIRQTVFAYDDARRMTSVGYDSDGDAIINETVSYEYDERGLRTKLTFDGKNITYSYDAKGRLISMTDWDSRTTTFDYDDANRHRLTTRHNDVTSAYAHNTAGQLTDIHHKDSTSATLAHFAYTLNGRGHRTQANETLNGTPKTITYAYDQLARVKNAKYYAGTVPTGTPADEYVYAFDVAGNRLSESHSVNGATPAVTDYEYNDANRVMTRTQNSVVDTFSYDNNGNLTSIDSLSYTWDRANRLRTVGAITYTYDGLGNRIQLFNQLGSSATETTTYLPDMQGGLTEVLQASTNQWIYGNSSSITRTYVHEPRGLGAYYLEKSGMAYAGFTPRWMDTFEDGLGSIRAEMNHNSQAIAGTRTMNPYGDVMTGYNYGAMDSGYGFTGEQIDPNELVYLRARYYDPTVGVFASLDPFEGVNLRPMSVNGYSWVEGNVANWVDSTGMSPLCGTSNECEQLRNLLALNGYTGNLLANILSWAGCTPIPLTPTPTRPPVIFATITPPPSSWPVVISPNDIIPPITAPTDLTCSYSGRIDERAICAIEKVQRLQTRQRLTWAEFLGITIHGEGGTIMQNAEGPCFTRNRSELLSGSNFSSDSNCEQTKRDLVYAIAQQLFAKCAGQTASGNEYQGEGLDYGRCSERGFIAFLDDIEAWYGLSQMESTGLYIQEATNELNSFGSYSGDRGYGQCPCRWGNVPFPGGYQSFEAIRNCTYSYVEQSGGAYTHFAIFGNSCG